MTTLKVNPLSQKSIRNAIEDLRNYKEALKSFPYLFITELMKEFENILDGQSPQSVKGLWNVYVRHSDDGSARGIVEFDGKVEFIEFGTGIVGEKNHLGINEDWLKNLPPPYTAYNRGPMIHHFENEDLDYWVYFDETGKHITHGVKANPFIYRSVVELMEKHDKIAREVFKANNIAHSYVRWE